MPANFIRLAVFLISCIFLGGCHPYEATKDSEQMREYLSGFPTEWSLVAQEDSSWVVSQHEGHNQHFEIFFQDTSETWMITEHRDSLTLHWNVNEMARQDGRLYFKVSRHETPGQETIIHFDPKSNHPSGISYWKGSPGGGFLMHGKDTYAPDSLAANLPSAHSGEGHSGNHHTPNEEAYHAKWYRIDGLVGEEKAVKGLLAVRSEDGKPEKGSYFYTAYNKVLTLKTNPDNTDILNEYSSKGNTGNLNLSITTDHAAGKWSSTENADLQLGCSFSLSNTDLRDVLLKPKSSSLTTIHYPQLVHSGNSEEAKKTALLFNSDFILKKVEQWTAEESEAGSGIDYEILFYGGDRLGICFRKSNKEKGNQVLETYNYDLKNNRILSVSDFFDDNEDFQKSLAKQLHLIAASEGINAPELLLSHFIITDNFIRVLVKSGESIYPVSVPLDRLERFRRNGA